MTTVAGDGRNAFNGDGGPATAASFQSIDGIAIDSDGNLFLSEYWGNRVRRVAPNGIITTYAGTGHGGFSGDGGAASQAEVNAPAGLAVNAEGDLFIADTGNHRIRRVTPPALPRIGITDAAVSAFAGRAGFSSNTYLEIFGENLSSTTRTWDGADFNGPNAPTSLDGVSVTVNGKPAFVFFISPTQININLPMTMRPGR